MLSLAYTQVTPFAVPAYRMFNFFGQDGMPGHGHGQGGGGGGEEVDTEKFYKNLGISKEATYVPPVSSTRRRLGVNSEQCCINA